MHIKIRIVNIQLQNFSTLTNTNQQIKLKIYIKQIYLLSSSPVRPVSRSHATDSSDP